MTKKFHIRYIVALIIPILALNLNAQNPLKKKLKGNKQTPHYSPSDYEFLNGKGKTVKLNPMLDNRSANWNKQVNDSVKIDLIQDFWNKKYSEIINEKIQKDFQIANINTKPSLEDGVYEITPKVEIHFPEYVVHPFKGYYVLSRIVMEVKQNNTTQFKKAYQDYFYFHKGISGYDEKYDKNYTKGTDMAMSISMKKVVDQFYDDLDRVFGGEKIKSFEGPIEVKSIASNISKDKNLNDDKKPFSEIKNKKEVMNTDLTANNYKVKEAEVEKPIKDPKLEEGLKTLGIDKKKEEEEKKQKALALKKKEEEAKRKMIEVEKKKTLALKKAEIAKKKKIDSIASAKKLEEEKLAKAKKLEEEKQAKLVQVKKDSIKKANELALAKKVAAQKKADSVKKAEVNKRMALAKELEAKKRKELEAKKLKAELAKKKLEAAKKKKLLALQQKKSVEKKKPSVTNKAKSYATKSTKRSDESMAEAVRRIAREIEAEERGTPLTKTEKSLIKNNSGKVQAKKKELAIIKKEAKVKNEVAKIKVKKLTLKNTNKTVLNS